MRGRAAHRSARVSARAPTPSRPTGPRRTARSPGTRRRSWWSRSRAAARPGSATPTATAAIAELIDGKLAEAVDGPRRHGPAGRVARRCSARCAIIGPRRAGGDGDLRRGRRALGSQGASCSACRWRCCSAATATRCRSTAAAASPPTTTSSCAASSRAGWSATAAAG